MESHKSLLSEIVAHSRTCCLANKGAFGPIWFRPRRADLVPIKVDHFCFSSETHPPPPDRAGTSPTSLLRGAAALPGQCPWPQGGGRSGPTRRRPTPSPLTEGGATAHQSPAQIPGLCYHIIDPLPQASASPRTPWTTENVAESF